jgi:hypothetical protein
MHTLPPARASKGEYLHRKIVVRSRGTLMISSTAVMRGCRCGKSSVPGPNPSSTSLREGVKERRIKLAAKLTSTHEIG